ncbi:MAG: hypothetical protein JW779_01685 [Candidatus Thorarchaeota archaeon]|nr:hypothetical protein [Candidatus Thorarchaeota archaeon]
MKPAVVQVAPDELKQIEKLILRNRDTISEEVKGKYESFRIRITGETVVAYTSGKIVSSGPQSDAVVQQVVRNLLGSIEEQDVDITIGSDEAGKGEWLGPLVVAAVALTPKQSRILQSLGVMDSKEIPITRMAEIALSIRQNCQSEKKILIAPETFNKRFDELQSEGKNLNDLLAWAHAKVISEIYGGIPSSKKLKVVIDEFAREKTRQRLERSIPLEDIELIQRPRAEDDISVAAASILARESREDWIDRYSDRLGIDLRELSPYEAINRSDHHSFSKIQYLKTLTKQK